MGPEDLMRAIKQRHPDVEAGEMVDPYIAAYEAGLNADSRAYDDALNRLEAGGALKRSAEFDDLTASVVGMNQQYEITPKGARLIADL